MTAALREQLPCVDWRDVPERWFDAFGPSLSASGTLHGFGRQWKSSGMPSVDAVAAWELTEDGMRRAAMVKLDIAFWLEIDQQLRAAEEDLARAKRMLQAEAAPTFAVVPMGWAAGEGAPC